MEKGERSSIRAGNNHSWWQPSCWPWSVTLQFLCRLAIWETTLPFLGSYGQSGFLRVEPVQWSTCSWKAKDKEQSSLNLGFTEPKCDRAKMYWISGYNARLGYWLGSLSRAGWNSVLSILVFIFLYVSRMCSESPKQKKAKFSAFLDFFSPLLFPYLIVGFAIAGTTFIYEWKKTLNYRKEQWK